MNEGFKGAAKGLASGLIGIVAKPVAGTVGFVQCSVQGAVNTPGTIKNIGKKDKVLPPEEHRSQIEEIFLRRKEEIRLYQIEK